jgi:hypothetical protein
MLTTFVSGRRTVLLDLRPCCPLLRLLGHHSLHRLQSLLALQTRPEASQLTVESRCL